MPGSPGVWTHRRFFELLAALGPLRVISISGPSVFEALCRFGRHGFAEGHMNAITPEYHWHVDLARFRFARSRDDVHARSGRRVLFLELAEAPDARPFLSVYMHRAKDAEFEHVCEKAFLDAHAELAAGCEIAGEGAA
jgi:hypothetical protein